MVDFPTATNPIMHGGLIQKVEAYGAIRFLQADTSGLGDLLQKLHTFSVNHKQKII